MIMMMINTGTYYRICISLPYHSQIDVNKKLFKGRSGKKQIEYIQDYAPKIYRYLSTVIIPR
jgi:hypothetical protein